MSHPVRRGFMLLEAAVALVVVGLIAGSSLALYGAGMRAAAREPRLLAATALAQDRLAAVRLLEPEQLRHLPDSVSHGRFGAPFADYRWQAVVAHSADIDLYDVRVEVRWSDGVFVLATRVYAPAGGTTK